MAFSGGTFSRIYNWVTDAAASVPITASRMDAEMDGMATGLSTCLLKDGTQTVTANIPMAGFKFTGVGAATASNQYITAGQIQNSGVIYCGTSGGTANAQTLTPSPVISAYAAGQEFSFLPVATNTSGTVTIANSGLAARNVKKGIGGAKVILAVGDIIIGVPAKVFDDGTDYILMNPKTYTHGADIASAATLNLDTATGDIVDVSGTTSITAITLSEGRQCTVRFTGILTLTQGASLILPTSGNITTVAGDYAKFRGYAGGVVRCVSYNPISGQSVSPNVGSRNLLVNGAFNVWQRATTYALTTSIVYGSADRWASQMATSAAGICNRDTTSLPSGFQYCAKVGRTNGSALTNAILLIQPVETANSIRAQGQKVTISFYAKAGANYSPTSSALNVAVYSGTGTDQSAASYATWTGLATIIGTNATLTTSWQRFTLTNVAVGSTATQLAAAFTMTPTGTAGADDNFYITGVQLEIGSEASPFDYRAISQELELCTRYYEKSFSYATAPAQSSTTTGAITVLLPTGVTGTFGQSIVMQPKRTAPTITTYNTSASNANWRDTTNSADRVVTVGTIGENSFSISGASGVAASTNRIQWAADSEL